jgi:Dolichyl-phosphate-mannose-protein mannosyltransferase
VAYALILVFTVYWGVQAFTLHRMGNYAVETDFYWKYGPAARDLGRGAVDIANYDSKGWGYPVVVAAVSVLGFETFRAAQIVSLLSAVLALLILYRLHRSLFGPGLALAALLLVVGNRAFLANTYEVGTDMFFLAVFLGSIALLLRSGAPGWRAVLFSGLLGGWAFSTRYNGAVLLPGALALFLMFRVPPGPTSARWKRAALWSAGFALAALPWLWINAAHTGNPLTNSNYVNVGYAVYGEGNWEKFFYGGDRKIQSFADVVSLDPGRFVAAMIGNVGDHLKRDLFELLSPPWGLLAIAGALLLLADRPGRRTAAYFTFGALAFVSLVPVFYGTRFSLPLLPFYTALATWPFGSPRVARLMAGIERVFPARAFLFLALWVPIAFASYAWTRDPKNAENVVAGPYDLTQVVEYLKEKPPGGAVIARKPHAAFLARMRFVPLPDVANPDSLHAVAVRENAQYLVISGIEYQTRAAARALATADSAAVPGFRRTFESAGGLVYEVVP